MPDRPATLRDVAAAAGVHPATASRALNPETRLLVSEETARRVTASAAKLGYRPNPVTQFAVQLMNAQGEGKPSPKPELHDPMQVKDTHDYAGQYVSRDGRSITVLADGERLTMRVGSQSVGLQSAGDDTFLATIPEFQRYPIVFGRAEPSAEEQAANKSPAVTELMHGPDWYVNDRYSGPREYAVPAHLKALAGHYRSDSVWLSSTRVVLRKGHLWLDGVARLEMLGEALFRMGEEAYNPDTVAFFYVADGKAQLMKLNGADLWRVDVP